MPGKPFPAFHLPPFIHQYWSQCWKNSPLNQMPSSGLYDQKEGDREGKETFLHHHIS